MKQFSTFLCDTWWYALSQRLDSKQFEKLARLRVKQGFTAVQLVVGIPPEVGPENPNAFAVSGVAWDLNGNFNQEYLKHAKERIEFLNSLGLKVIVYGAWGHQIEWLGVSNMKEWWSLIVEYLDDLDVMYCLTGESNLWLLEPELLLPDKSTKEAYGSVVRYFLHPRIMRFITPVRNFLRNKLLASKTNERIHKWSEVLTHLNGLTSKPILIHVLPRMTSAEAVEDSSLLNAVTVQTGHSEEMRRFLYQLPYQHKLSNPKSKFINLEPWYDGIVGKFGKDDQIFAYWVTMLGGADAYCYGAHGIWNVGDGEFLSQWGNQTLEEAMELDTPMLIGLSHNLFVSSNFSGYPTVEIAENNDKLVSIARIDGDKSVVFYPDCSDVEVEHDSQLFVPTLGKFVNKLPSSGQLVVISG